MNQEKAKVVYANDCPRGKRYIMSTVYLKDMLDPEIVANYKTVEIRHPEDREGSL